MKAIAIDDEPVALDIVRMMAEKVQFITLEETFTNAFKALDYLRHSPVDLIFMDISMPDISGIDLVKSLPRKPLIIFTTAYSEHAVESFDLDAVDFLLKPFSAARFIRACNKAYEIYSVRNTSQAKNHLFLKDGTDQVKVFFDDIAYIEATGNYLQVITPAQKIITRMTISECEQLLPADQFIRVHRSYIVSRNKITRVQRHQLVINDQAIPIGASYLQSLNEVFPA